MKFSEQKSCQRCGEIEPQNHDDSWWLCSCKTIENSNLDSILADIEANFDKLWEETQMNMTPITMTHTCDFAEIEEEWEVTK